MVMVDSSTSSLSGLDQDLQDLFRVLELIICGCCSTAAQIGSVPLDLFRFSVLVHLRTPGDVVFRLGGVFFCSGIGSVRFSKVGGFEGECYLPLGFQYRPISTKKSVTNFWNSMDVRCSLWLWDGVLFVDLSRWVLGGRLVVVLGSELLTGND